MKVFLGGTCSGYDWRKMLIPMLKCAFYDPRVKDWSEDDRLREVHMRDKCDYVLYVITSGIRGVYSIAEVIDDSNKRPEKTIVCVLYGNMRKNMAHSLKAVVNLAKSNGVIVCETLEEVAEFLNDRAAREFIPVNTRKFTTLVNSNDRLWNTHYVYGKINAIFRLKACPINGINQGFVSNLFKEEGQWFYQFETTEDDYRRAAEIIAVWYPGLCEFDCSLTLKEEE